MAHGGRGFFFSGLLVGLGLVFFLVVRLLFLCVLLALYHILYAPGCLSQAKKSFVFEFSIYYYLLSNISIESPSPFE